MQLLGSIFGRTKKGLFDDLRDVDRALFGYLDIEIQQGANINVMSSSGWTPLMWQASNLQSKNVRKLINAGADVNTKNNDGATALIYAIEKSGNEEERLRCVRMIVNAGADLNIKVKRWFYDKKPTGELEILTPYELALRTHRTAIAELLRAKMDEFRDLFLSGSKDEIKAAIDNGKDVNARDSQHNTPLMLAFSNPNLDEEMLKILINAGADLNAQNSEGRTALMFLVSNPDMDVNILKTLLKAGVNVHITFEENVADITGGNYMRKVKALDVAKRANNFEAVSILQLLN